MNETEGGRPCSRLAAFAIALLLSLLWLALQGVGLGGIPFHSKGEPREAVVVQDIVNRGDWILPRRNASEIVRKPPLFYWLGALAARASGRVDEGTVRLPSALQSWAACMLLLLLATATGGPGAAFFAGVVLLTSFEWLRAATTARVDMTLALGTTASFVGLTLFERRRKAGWLVLAYAGMVWGTLAKGPIAVALPVLFVIVRAAWRAGAAWILLAYAVVVFLLRAFAVPTALALLVHAVFAAALLLPLRGLGRFRPLTGLAAVGGCAGLWYALAALRGGPTFFMTQIVEENLARFTGGAASLGGHAHSPAYLAAALLAGCLPWTLFLPAALRDAAPLPGKRPDSVALSALLWCAVIFAFFSLAESKRSVYLLPMYPALALLIGRFLAAYATRPDADRATTAALAAVSLALAALSGVLGLAFAADAAGFPLVRAAADLIPLSTRPAAARAIAELAARAAPLAVAFACCCAFSLSGAALARTRARRRAPLAFGAAAATLMVASQQLILPAVALANSRRDYAAALGPASGGGTTLATTPHYDYATVFYRNGIPVHAVAAGAAPPYLLIRRDDWRGLDWRARAMYQPVPGMDLAKQNNQASYLLVERVAPLSDESAPGGDAGE